MHLPFITTYFIHRALRNIYLVRLGCLRESERQGVSTSCGNQLQYLFPMEDEVPGRAFFDL